MFKPVDPHPNFPKLEEEILRFWEKEKIFEKSLAKTKKGKPFVFYEGPPTANAAPGIHHVEARSFKDLIPRYQTMRGRYVVRKAGWDTHGLPVELQVEKSLNISGKKQIESLKPTVHESITYFNELCKKSVWKYKEEWEKLTRRMGFWIDLEHPYITYENSYIEKVWGILKKIWQKGLIYRGHKVVPYCPRCGTALSSHEVAQGYERITENSFYVKFKVKNHNAPFTPSYLKRGEGELYVLSWTTTPWTLPGNVALAVGEDIEYVKVKQGDEYYIVAKKTLSSVMPDLIRHPGLDSLSAAGMTIIKGKDLAGLEYEPLFDLSRIYADSTRTYGDKIYRLYAADFVNTEEGTGVVHTAVMYGEDDYQLGEKEGLPKHHTVDEEGKFTDDLKAYGLAGLEVKGAQTEKRILEYLKKKGLLFKEEKYEHDYPFCWRCNHYLIYYARNSWFIKMSSLRQDLIKNNQTINWIPEYIKEGRFGEWLREIKDWAISRERYWGTPLPFWKCKECGECKVIGSLEELQKESVSPDLTRGPGVDSRFRGNDKKRQLDLHRPYVDEITLKCDKCGGEAIRVPEVLDVWFDSGVMPFASGQNQFPADFISEAVDQTRGWFYTLLAISTLLGKGPAYKNVICLGHVLDEKGEKMSKSKGNVVDPFEMGNKYGFDVLRWYFYTVNQPGDTKLFTEKDIQSLQRRMQLIFWNIYNYFITYANGAGWQFTRTSLNESEKSKNILDRWQNARLQELVKEVTDDLDKFDIFTATRRLDWFVTNSFSTWYLRRNRGRNDRAFFATMHRSLVTLSKLLAPFMPFLSEHIYQNLTGEQSVHLSDWPPKLKKLNKNQNYLIDVVRELRRLVEEAHALRAKQKIKLRQPLRKFTVPRSDILDTAKGKDREDLLKVLKDEINVEEVIFGDKLDLDIKPDDKLILKGLVRELERRINEFRKESGLKIGELVELYYETESAMIEKAMQQVDRKKTYLLEIRPFPEPLPRPGEGGRRPGEVDFEKQIEIEGQKLWLYIKNTPE